jgi:hypothetical protein
MSYFNNRYKDKQARYQAATGNPVQTGFAGLISAFRK